MFTKQLKRELIHSFTAGALSREYLRDLQRFAPSVRKYVHQSVSCCAAPLVRLYRHPAESCSCCSRTTSVQTRFQGSGGFVLPAPDH
jgi:hypothetical protein